MSEFLESPQLANPWLADPMPAGRLQREVLEERIVQLLATSNICVLSLNGAHGPIATPVRYVSDRLTVWFTTWATAPKIRMLERDPRIAAGIFVPLVNEASSRGCQISGIARIHRPGSPGFDAGMAIFPWRDRAAELGRTATETPSNPIVEIVPQKIVYTEHWLRKTGFAARQIWRADKV